MRKANSIPRVEEEDHQLALLDLDLVRSRSLLRPGVDDVAEGRRALQSRARPRLLLPVDEELQRARPIDIRLLEGVVSLAHPEVHPEVQLEVTRGVEALRNLRELRRGGASRQQKWIRGLEAPTRKVPNELTTRKLEFREILVPWPPATTPSVVIR